MHPVSAVAAIAAITIALTAAAYPHPAAAAATAAKSAAAPPPAFRFAATYGDHMVLKSAPAAAVIWGFGTAGSSVTVTSTAGAGFTATVAADSTWIGKLAPTESKDANTGDMVTAAVTATQGSDSINITDVLFGEVWVCGGQSNMQFTVDQAFNASAEVAAADGFPNIRLFTVGETQSTTPVVDVAKVSLPWSVASSASVGGGNWTFFSATCWFYGRDLYQRIQKPLGLIESCWGGTPDEAWSSPDALAKCNPNTAASELGADAAVATADAAETSVTHLRGPHADSVLWNAMIVPLLKTTITGAIWYQGEADCQAVTGPAYACSFPAMIADWRAKWHTASLGETDTTYPFGFVQLSTWGDGNNTTTGFTPIVRWGQTANYSYVPNKAQPNVFMAVAMDLGDPHSPFGDIHPRFKQQVGTRLAAAGYAVAYDNPDTYWTGPIASTATVDGAGAILRGGDAVSTVTVAFTHAGASGIEVRYTEGDFDILDKTTGTWVAAMVQSSSSSVTVAAASVSVVPAGVRYEWRQAPCRVEQGIEKCAVYAKAEGLPAAPFQIML